MLLAVPLGERGTRPLRVDDPRLCRLDRAGLRDCGNGFGRLAGGDHSDLIEEDFFLRLFRLRAHHVVVQLVEPREDDVLLVVERHGVLPVAVVGEAALAFLDLGLLLGHLLLEPVDHVLRALELDGKVLLDVLVHQRVDRKGRELRVERGERDVHEPAAGDGDHGHVADEGADESRFVRRFINLRRLGYRRPARATATRHAA